MLTDVFADSERFRDADSMVTTGASWQRLGSRLMHRRIELGFRTRKDFQLAIGARNSGERRTVLDIENGNRENYAAATIAWIEHIYQWAPGSVEAVLSGGEPTPADETSHAARQVRQHVEESIRDDRVLTRRDKELLIDMYRRLTGR